MARYYRFLAVALLVFIVASSVVARGPFITPGARATGFGTAFVSIADDLTAIYWNPAGLAYQKDKQVMFSLYGVAANATCNDTVGFKKYETSALIPFLGFSMPYNETMTVAFGVYASGGGGGKVSNIEPYQIEGQQSFTVYNVSVAKKINDKLSVGIGFEGIEMKDKLIYKIPYAWLGLPYPGNTDVDYNRSAFGFQGNIGIMYKPVEKLSTGFMLRSGTYIGLPKETNSSNPSFVDGYTYPMTMELGASYKISDPLTVAFAAAYNKYSWTSAQYQDTVQFRLGSEYKATDKLALHLGFFTDPNIYKDSGVSGANYNVTNIDMYNMQYLCMGAEYNVTKSVNLGLTYTHSFTQDVVSNGVTYEYPVDMFRFDVGYKF